MAQTKREKYPILETTNLSACVASRTETNKTHSPNHDKHRDVGLMQFKVHWYTQTHQKIILGVLVTQCLKRLVLAK